MKVNCIHCGHGFGVDDSYCDYEGLIRCSTCGGLLDVRFEDGLIKAVRPGMLSAPVAPSYDTPSRESSIGQKPVQPSATPASHTQTPAPATPASVGAEQTPEASESSDGSEQEDKRTAA